ncbi:hypothetical protein BH18ACT15_BH18ACT15_04810 [soil metagenome]
MERGSNTSGPRLDEARKKEDHALETSAKESHVEPERETERVEDPVLDEDAEDFSGYGHRIAGTGSSADEYSLTDHGEEGGASHPVPKDPAERSERVEGGHER